jgi:hypothetical protein
MPAVIELTVTRQNLTKPFSRVCSALEIAHHFNVQCDLNGIPIGEYSDSIWCRNANGVEFG